MKVELSKTCNHHWITNSGRGGTPIFRANWQMSREPTMHVRCKHCGTRTWFTKSQWDWQEHDHG